MAADGGDEDLDDAIAAARRAFDGTDWATNVERRVAGLRQLQAAFTAHADDIRAMTVAETGSPVSLTSSAQLDDPVGSLGWVADLLEGYEWETDLGDAAPLGSPPTGGCGGRPPGWWGPSPPGTSPTRSTWPSWGRRWPPATPWS